MSEGRMMLHVRLRIECGGRRPLAREEDEEAGEVLIGAKPFGADVGVAALRRKQRPLAIGSARSD